MHARWFPRIVTRSELLIEEQKSEKEDESDECEGCDDSECLDCCEHQERSAGICYFCGTDLI